MTYYVRMGSSFSMTDSTAIEVSDSLPAANYVVKFDEKAQSYSLEMTDDFKSLPKYYGKIPQFVERIHRTFCDRPNTTGVLLTGEKGSGKTLLAKEISIKGKQLGIPTIIINQDYSGDAFNKFIQSIDQPAIVLFDEFEKIYVGKKQEEILTLLDGVFPTKKLFIISCNDMWKIDSHMRNRPGRLYYMIEFTGIEKEFILEYCADHDISSTEAEKIVAVSSLYKQFNFDILKAVVEEMKRFGEGAEEALKFINARPEYDNGSEFEIDLVYKGQKVSHTYPATWERNPLGESISIGFYCKQNGVVDDEEGDNYMKAEFEPNDIVSVDKQTGVYTLNNGVYELRLIRKSTKSFDYTRIF